MGRKQVLREHEKTVVKWKGSARAFLSLNLMSPFVPRAAQGENIFGSRLRWEANCTYPAPYSVPTGALEYLAKCHWGQSGVRKTATATGQDPSPKQVLLVLTVQLTGIRV